MAISLAQCQRHTANAGKLRIFSPFVELLAPPQCCFSVRSNYTLETHSSIYVKLVSEHFCVCFLPEGSRSGLGYSSLPGAFIFLQE